MRWCGNVVVPCGTDQCLYIGVVSMSGGRCRTCLGKLGPAPAGVLLLKYRSGRR